MFITVIVGGVFAPTGDGVFPLIGVVPPSNPGSGGDSTTRDAQVPAVGLHRGAIKTQEKYNTSMYDAIGVSHPHRSYRTDSPMINNKQLLYSACSVAWPRVSVGRCRRTALAMRRYRGHTSLLCMLPRCMCVYTQTGELVFLYALTAPHHLGTKTADIFFSTAPIGVVAPGGAFK